jgi:hypothetical protein
MKLFLPSLLWSLCLAYTTAEVVYRSEDPDPIYGPPSPCPGFQQTNATYFNVSYTPENSKITLRFSSSGLTTLAGDTRICFALFEDGEQVLEDPALASVDGTSGNPVDLASSIWIPERFSANINEKLPTANNFAAQLWVEAVLLGGRAD